MKHKQALRTITTVVLALLLLLTPAALAEETQESAVDWNLSFEDMMTLEGVTKDSLYAVESGAYAQYGCVRLDRAYTYAAIYVYAGDQLVMRGENASSVMQRTATDFAVVYEERLPALLEAYGEATIDDIERMIRASNTVEEDAIWVEDVISAVGWDLGDGTALFHLYSKNTDAESVITIFVNEAALYAQ